MSIATEITRLQNAKASLKTSINAKTDNEHQIADETLEDYASFVDTISSGGGQAYRLPDTYQEVTYIESSGTQYINTGYYAKGTSQFKLKVYNKTSSGVLFGAYNTDWTTGCGYYHSNSSTGHDWIHYYNNTGTDEYGSTNSIQEIYYNKGTIYVNGTLTHSENAKSFTINYPTYIFTGNWTGSRIEQPVDSKLYYFKILENGTLIRDFVPCYRKSDSVIGLYDLVNDTFYTNAGTGTFTKGEDHNTPLVNLQTKSVSITQNTITEVTPDTGYDGLESVTVTTNVTDPTPTYSYEQNGLIAWYEGEDNFDNNEHLNSRVGNDYLYVYSRLIGTKTTNPATTYNGNIVNLGGYVYASSRDYFVNGYTIEIVGFTSGCSNASTEGCWLYTGNTNQTAGIGAIVNNGDRIIFQNDGADPSSVTFTRNKPFSASVYFKTNIGRQTTVPFTTKGSINGQGYVEYTGISNYHNVKTGGAISLFLSYYTNNYLGYGGIKSIRVYNRALTEQEMYNNYLVDKARFDLESA